MGIRHALIALGLALPWSGCNAMTALEVDLAGAIHTADEDGALSFTAQGHPRIYDRPVHLPRAQEDERYGLVLIDVSTLPAGWRPPHASRSSIVVSAVDRASPLARGGLRSLDCIEAVDGEPADSVDQVVAALRARDRVSVSVVKPDGSRHTISAAAAQDLHDTEMLWLPLVLSTATAETGTGFTLGPFGQLFSARSVALTNDERYVERTEWAALFEWFMYQSETDLETGETRRRFRLFWLFDFGDATSPWS